MVPAHPRGAGRALLLLFALIVMGVIGGTSPAAAAPPEGATWTLTVDGRDVATADANAPLRLQAEQLTRLVLTVDNGSADPMTVRSVRLRGSVFGLSFFSYATRLDLVVAPGQTEQRRIDLDLDDLGRQATGLIPAEVQLVDSDRAVLDSRSFAADVDGSAFSVYALFGLAVAAMTALLVVALLLAILQGRLQPNRWRRGLQFLPVGIGLGLTATFTLSALRLLIPSASRWVPLVLVLGAVALLVGYFLPTGRPAEEAAPSKTEAAEPVRQGHG